jgi:hypothetical protein
MRCALRSVYCRIGGCLFLDRCSAVSWEEDRAGRRGNKEVFSRWKDLFVVVLEGWQVQGVAL